MFVRAILSCFSVQICYALFYKLFLAGGQVPASFIRLRPDREQAEIHLYQGLTKQKIVLSSLH